MGARHRSGQCHPRYFRVAEITRHQVRARYFSNRRPCRAERQLAQGAQDRLPECAPLANGHCPHDVPEKFAASFELRDQSEQLLQGIRRIRPFTPAVLRDSRALTLSFSSCGSSPASGAGEPAVSARCAFSPLAPAGGASCPSVAWSPLAETPRPSTDFPQPAQPRTATLKMAVMAVFMALWVCSRKHSLVDLSKLPAILNGFYSPMANARGGTGSRNGASLSSTRPLIKIL